MLQCCDGKRRMSWIISTFSKTSFLLQWSIKYPNIGILTPPFIIWTLPRSFLITSSVKTALSPRLNNAPDWTDFLRLHSSKKIARRHIFTKRMKAGPAALWPQLVHQSEPETEQNQTLGFARQESWERSCSRHSHSVALSPRFTASEIIYFPFLWVKKNETPASQK